MCRSLEISFTNCKVELQLKWIRQCVLAAAVDNATNDDNTIFTLKDPNLYVPVVMLLAKDNQNWSKRLSKGFGRSMYLNEYKTKSEIKTQQTSVDIFLNQTLQEFTVCLF